ncbi:HTTM domain-containing protein [Streptomyces sp. NRRL S-350]|uniref:HTTM domain-containing protein n=1 Tax=Streptomyces sp. NRRL S-350 TaxID=1463902 RepID=UPI0006910D85|nr:HTTM domain-containing protein [Streptomyces sp. NRRL S-350]
MNEVSERARRPDGTRLPDGAEGRAGAGQPPVPGPDAPAPRRAGAGTGAAGLLGRAAGAFTGRVLGRHQAAVVRIGFGLVWLAYLLREWPNRRVLYGDRSPLSMELAVRLLGDDGAFTVLPWFGGQLWFELVYHLAVLAALAVLLGWRTRASTVLFLVTVLSLQNRDVFLGDGGDNVVHLMAVYLVFTRCGRVWSLDARRARLGRTGWTEWTGVALWAVLGAALAVCQAGDFSGRSLTWTGRTFPYLGWAPLFWGLWAVAGLWWVLGRLRPDGEPRAVLDALATMVHNCAMLVIAVEVVLIYATAGWYKVQGTRWQDGTALYYPLHLDYFTPWPGLSALVGSALLPVFLVSYGTVIVQVAFPFTLLNRRVKNVLLAVMMLEHVGIAVVLGLPVFSLAMIAADAVFLPTGALLWLAARARRIGARPMGREPAP